jgi:putative Holliday junction resolvase
MRVLAIDYGAKGVGVAITDELRLTVRPLSTIRRRGRSGPVDLVGAIEALVRQYEVGTVVVGLPLRMDGGRGEAAQRVERFAERLRGGLFVPVVLVDERLSSREADARLRASGASLAERRRDSDAYAAIVILEDYLSTLLSEACLTTSPLPQAAGHSIEEESE